MDQEAYRQSRFQMSAPPCTFSSNLGNILSAYSCQTSVSSSARLINKRVVNTFETKNFVLRRPIILRVFAYFKLENANSPIITGALCLFWKLGTRTRSSS